VNSGLQLPPLSWSEWLSAVALSLAIVALALWVADRLWSLWRLRRRPLEATSKTTATKVRVGEPVAWVVTLVNRSPRVLRIRLGAVRTQVLTIEREMEEDAFGNETTRRLSDFFLLPRGQFVEFGAYDRDTFRTEEETIRPGSGTIAPLVEIQGIAGRADSIVRLPTFAFEVVP
jgi:hypothetical protein